MFHNKIETKKLLIYTNKLIYFDNNGGPRYCHKGVHENNIL